MKTNLTIPVENLDEAVKFFTDKLKFRVEMVLPADAPQIVVVSGHGALVQLERRAGAKPHAGAVASPPAYAPVISLADDAKWVEGRAGMEYRDLIPGRLGGRVVASLIRLGSAGPITDFVHYHKIKFQLIYCWHGRVRVVYEDQGDPFWLHPGDCVLQPPLIRHRVLESAGRAQVIEVTSPGTHETWQDHDMALPTGRVLPDRDFSGQRFVYHRAAESTVVPDEFGQFESHHFGIATATGGALAVIQLRSPRDRSTYRSDGQNTKNVLLFLLTGRVDVAVAGVREHHFTPGDSVLVPPNTVHQLTATANAEILRVEL